MPGDKKCKITLIPFLFRITAQNTETREERQNLCSDVIIRHGADSLIL